MSLTALDNEQLVRTLFARWGESLDALCQSLQLLSEDCLWIQSGLPDLRGSAAGIDFVRQSSVRLGYETVKVDIVRLVADERTVASERVDHLRRADASTILSIPVAGIMDMRNGQIIGWREYFDASALKP
jgi:limonene-1,2-epoxide hydrolase